LVNLRKAASLLVLGFSSGLPLNLVSKTFQAWMAHEKVDLAHIGLFSLAMAPYSLKFLWAPLLDRFPLPWAGRRRGWIMASQVLLGLAIAVLAFLDPRGSLEAVAAAVVVVAFLSASQDIAFDAWRVEQLSEPERGPGAALGVLGYRLALLSTGSACLILADHLSWRTVYLLLALLQVALVLPAWLAPEVVRDHSPSSLREAVVEPFVAFFGERGVYTALSSLAFIVFFKWGVYLVQSLSMPFLLAHGYTQTETGTVLGGAGLLATILGTLAGGMAVAKLPLRVALVSFGVLQASAGLLFWDLSGRGHDLGWMTAAVVSENFFVGMGTSALVAWLLGICQPRYAATQFALLSSLMAFGRDLLTAPAGYVAQSTGWPAFFLWTVVACLPGLVLVGPATRKGGGSALP
jgi:PAT family beta-lactamase induction signal transducer AmpG